MNPKPGYMKTTIPRHNIMKLVKTDEKEQNYSKQI